MQDYAIFCILVTAGNIAVHFIAWAFQHLKFSVLHKHLADSHGSYGAIRTGQASHDACATNGGLWEQEIQLLWCNGAEAKLSHSLDSCC